MRVAALVGVVAAVAVVGTAPLWSGHVFADARWLSVGLLSAGIAGFCMHATLLGVLAGVNRGASTGRSSSATRSAGCPSRPPPSSSAGVWSATCGRRWPARSPGWCCCCVPATRAAARLLTPGTTTIFLRGASHSIAAAGASAILIMGFPVLLKATSADLGAAGGVVSSR